MKQTRAKEEERGFALLLVFLLAAGIAISLYMEMPRIAFETQRNREQLTVDRANQYKRAIQVFVRANKRYPAKIEDLESFNDKRYLRHRYVDPMTGKDDWRFVHVGPNGVLTDSLVQKANNPLGGKDDKDKDQSASSTTPDPNATPSNPNVPAGFNAAKMRPSDTMNLTATNGGSPPPGADPSQPGVYPVAQYPQQPGVQPGVQPGIQPGVQPYPGQPGVPQYPGQPVQQYPGVPTYPGQPGQPVQYPGQPVQPGVTPGVQPYPGQPVTPGQNYPNQQGMYPGQQPMNTGSIPQPTNATPQFGTATNSSAPGAANSALGAIQKSIFGAAPASAFSNPGAQGMGSGIAGVGLPAESKGAGIMVVKERTKYREWEFIYDPKEDKNVVGAAAAAQNQAPMQNNNPLGPSTPTSPNPVTPNPTTTPQNP